jgi:hypothetical protein
MINPHGRKKPWILFGEHGICLCCDDIHENGSHKATCKTGLKSKVQLMLFKANG